MILNLSNLNVRGLRDQSKCVRLPGELLSLCVDVVTVQETQFNYRTVCRLMEDDYVALSVFSSRCCTGVSLLIGRVLNAMTTLFLLEPVSCG